MQWQRKTYSFLLFSEESKTDSVILLHNNFCTALKLKIIYGNLVSAKYYNHTISIFVCTSMFAWNRDIEIHRK